MAGARSSSWPRLRWASVSVVGGRCSFRSHSSRSRFLPGTRLDSEREPLPLWFGVICAQTFAVPLVLIGVIARRLGDTGSLGEQRANLGVLREPALLLLREDELPVREHVVLALGALFDLGLVLGLVVQLGRETRGPCVVAVSDGAVLDLNFAPRRQTYPLRSS